MLQNKRRKYGYHRFVMETIKPRSTLLLLAVILNIASFGYAQPPQQMPWCPLVLCETPACPKEQQVPQFNEVGCPICPACAVAEHKAEVEQEPIENGSEMSGDPTNGGADKHLGGLIDALKASFPVDTKQPNVNNNLILQFLRQQFKRSFEKTWFRGPKPPRPRNPNSEASTPETTKKPTKAPILDDPSFIVEVKELVEYEVDSTPTSTSSPSTELETSTVSQTTTTEDNNDEQTTSPNADETTPPSLSDNDPATSTTTSSTTTHNPGPTCDEVHQNMYEFSFQMYIASNCPMMDCFEGLQHPYCEDGVWENRCIRGIDGGLCPACRECVRT